MESDLSIDVDELDTSVTMKLAGEVDYGNVARLRAALVDSTGDGRQVVVDLGGVTFLDSMALSVLIQGKRNLEDRGGLLTVANVPPRVRHVCELAGVADYLLG